MYQLFTLSGMSSKLFQGLENIQVLQCSAKSLPENSDVLYMILYEMFPTRTILRANLRSGVCSSQELFASCDIDGSDTQNIRLNALIPNLAEGRSRSFGCNVTALIFEGFVQTFSWTFNVRHLRESMASFMSLYLCVDTSRVSCRRSFAVSLLLLLRHYICVSTLHVFHVVEVLLWVHCFFYVIISMCRHFTCFMS